MFSTFTGNGSILAIAIASVFMFPIAMFLKRQRLKFALLLAFFVFCFLFFLQARAACIGFVAGIYCINKYYQFLRLKPVHLLLTSVVLIAALFYLKQNSSEGRLLIYKIATNIFKEHPLSGIGLGNFKLQYNLYQAKYFAAHDINNKEALLADNTFYAFNDLFQWLIELGTIRFLLLGIGIALIVPYLYKAAPFREESKHWFYGSFSALVCIAIASLFSYPFQVQLMQLLVVAYLFFIFFFLQAKTKISNAFLIFSKIACVLSFIYVGWAGYQQWQVQKRGQQAFDLSRTGFKKEALQQYQSLISKHPIDGILLFAYARQLYYLNQTFAAKEIITKAKQYYTDNELYRFSAAIEQDLGNSKAAEKDYLTALYMVPNRMQSRFALFQFYLFAKDTIKAITWGNSILTMPVKIPSERTENMLQQTKKMMQEIKQ